MMKTRQENDMTERTGAVYKENDIELSSLIGLGVVCDENQTGQHRD